MAVEFHTLTVARVEPVTDNSVAVTFDVPEGDLQTFAHEAGQHVIVKATIDGESVRRSYSICSPVGSSELTIGIRHLDGGVFSSYANSVLSAGDAIEVTPPTGDFTIATDSQNKNHYIAIAAGSGITPVLSMISSVLAVEPASRFTLIYGNRDGRSIMFLDELDALKNRYPDRFVMFHILSRESHAIELFEGRIDEEKLIRLFSTVVDAGTATDWYLCGPSGIVRAARSVLTAGGVPESNIHDELFFAGDDTSFVPVSDDEVGSEVKFTLNGRTSTIIVDPTGAPILDHALAVRPDTPFSCRSGACASCRATVTDGKVVMDKNWSLNQEEVDAGQILTCQSHPVSEVVELTYDA
ncbi:MAG: 2Fe-2S iron-sulfur cluster-binding protein [Actinomycetota bacterium]